MNKEYIEGAKTTVSQMIEYQNEEHRRRAFEQCLRRGFHKPYPDGYFERCFNCGSPLTLTLLKEDELYKYKHEFLDLMSAYSKNEDVDMFRLHRVAHKIGISI